MPSGPPPGKSSEPDERPDAIALSDRDILTVTQAAIVAGASEETIRAWFDSGELDGDRDGRGRRRINGASLARRLDSVGVNEAARLADCSPYTIRQWFDRGVLDGYRTASGRRRVHRGSIDRELARQQAALGLR